MEVILPCDPMEVQVLASEGMGLQLAACLTLMTLQSR